MNTHNRINYNNVLPDLQYFMLTSKIIVNALSNRLLIEQNKNVKPIHTCKPKPEPPSIFIPKQQDSLFVCFYKIINKDVDDKENITFTTEKNLKIEYVDKLRKNKEIVKKYKFASITHIENQLVNENKIDINTFLTLCVIENINIIYIHNKIYYELLINPESVDDNIHIIHFFDKLTKYGYEGHSQDKIINYKQILFKVDNINKPLKAISFYKIQDLIDTCNKLAIDITSDTNKPKLKKDLYELIIKSL
jgi:hypothetical protein